MPAAVAIPLIVAGVSAGASVGTAVYQSKQNEKAANAQLSAADRARAMESSSFDKSIEAAQDEQDYNRWLTQATAEARQPYLDQLAASIGQGFGSYAPSTYTPERYTAPTYTAPTYEAAKPFVAPDPNKVREDPGFQFELGQGVDAINRTGAARGTLLTGGTLKDAESFGQGLAATRAGEQRDRALQEYSLAETLRSQAFDRNASNQFAQAQFNSQAGFNASQLNNQSGYNAAQLNNQSAYNAASLANQGAGQRLSALSSLASLALPTGQYPGRQGGDQHILPVPTNQWGVPLYSTLPVQNGGSGGSLDNPPMADYSNGGTDPSKMPFGPFENDDTPWSGLIRRNY